MTEDSAETGTGAAGEPGSRLYRLAGDLPPLRSPVMVAAPEGWIDAGLGGAAALSVLAEQVETTVVARFDIDSLLDHRARRPVARIVDGVYGDLRWPEIELRAGTDAAGNDVLLLVGPEPDNLWLSFSSAVAELAVRLGTRMFVGLGAFPAPVPHTRPIRLAATATTAELAQRVGVVPGELDVPAGILIPVQQALAKAGIPAMALWARVPHYAAGMPYPAASLVLLEGLAEVTGVTADLAHLREAASGVTERLDALIANSMEHRAMIAQLEARFDSEVPTGGLGGTGDFGEVGGDELIAEVERFLRDQGS